MGDSNLCTDDPSDFIACDFFFLIQLYLSYINISLAPLKFDLSLNLLYLLFFFKEGALVPDLVLLILSIKSSTTYMCIYIYVVFFLNLIRY